MTALWRRTLQQVQKRFEEAAPERHPLRCLLVEHATPEQRKPELPPLKDFSEETTVYWATGVYRNVRFIQNADGTPVFTDKPVLDVDGKPIVNSAGEAYAIERGAVRTLQVHGEYEAFQCFSQIATQAGCSVPAMPPAVRNMLFPGTVRETDPLKCWLYVLFDLAWRNMPGSPLKAERYTWVGDTSVSLRSLPNFRRAAAIGAKVPHPELLAQIPDPPDRFYSVLDNIGLASIAAVDILLTSAGENTGESRETEEVLLTSTTRFADAATSPNAELLKLADTQIRLEVAEQGQRLQRAIAQGMGEMGARGVLHSSMTLNMIIGHCCDAIAERAQIAWTTIKRYIAEAGITYSNALGAELKLAVTAHLPEDHGDIAAILERYLERIQLRGIQMQQRERLDAARSMALAQAYGAIDLFVLSVRKRQAQTAPLGQSVNIAVNAPVGALQIGDSNVASVVQQWTAEKRDDLLKALERIEDAVRSQQIPNSISEEQLRTLLREAQSEAREDKPNISRLKSLLSQLAAVIQIVAALKPAYTTLLEIARWLGQ